MAFVVYLFDDRDAPNEKAARFLRNAGLKSLWDHVLKEGKDEGKKRIYSRTVVTMIWIWNLLPICHVTGLVRRD